MRGFCGDDREDAATKRVDPRKASLPARPLPLPSFLPSLLHVCSQALKVEGQQARLLLWKLLSLLRGLGPAEAGGFSLLELEDCGDWSGHPGRWGDCPATQRVLDVALDRCVGQTPFLQLASA